MTVIVGVKLTSALTCPQSHRDGITWGWEKKRMSSKKYQFICSRTMVVRTICVLNLVSEDRESIIEWMIKKLNLVRPRQMLQGRNSRLQKWHFHKLHFIEMAIGTVYYWSLDCEFVKRAILMSDGRLCNWLASCMSGLLIDLYPIVKRNRNLLLNWVRDPIVQGFYDNWLSESDVEPN